MFQWMKRKTLLTIVQEHIADSQLRLLDARAMLEQAEAQAYLYESRVVRLQLLERSLTAPTLEAVVAPPAGEPSAVEFRLVARAESWLASSALFGAARGS